MNGVPQEEICQEHAKGRYICFSSTLMSADNAASLALAFWTSTSRERDARHASTSETGTSSMPKRVKTQTISKRSCPNSSCLIASRLDLTLESGACTLTKFCRPEPGFRGEMIDDIWEKVIDVESSNTQFIWKSSPYRWYQIQRACLGIARVRSPAAIDEHV